MDLRLQNTWDYEGDEYWNWSAFLTGADLPKVDFVEYILHPTFTKPVRKIREASNGFRLETAGWGSFDLKAIVHFKNGREELLTHEIELRTSPKHGSTHDESVSPMPPASFSV